MNADVPTIDSPPKVGDSTRSMAGTSPPSCATPSRPLPDSRSIGCRGTSARPNRRWRALESSGQFAREVLDIGCGPGENALFLASRGYRVWGLDAAPAAIDIARERARQRGMERGVEFEVADATDLSDYADRFVSVIDSATLPLLPRGPAPPLAASLFGACRPQARLHVVCFSDRVPDGFPGPYRITEDNLRTLSPRRMDGAAHRTDHLHHGLHSGRDDDAARFPGRRGRCGHAGRRPWPAARAGLARDGRTHLSAWARWPWNWPRRRDRVGVEAAQSRGTNVVTSTDCSSVSGMCWFPASSPRTGRARCR